MFWIPMLQMTMTGQFILGNFLHFSFLAIKREKILISREKSEKCEKWKIPIHTTHDVENWPPKLFLLHFYETIFLEVWNFGKNLFSKNFNLEPSWFDHFYVTISLKMAQFTPNVMADFSRISCIEFLARNARNENCEKKFLVRNRAMYYNVIWDLRQKDGK